MGGGYSAEAASSMTVRHGGYGGDVAARPAQVTRFLGRNAKRVAVSVVGGILVVAGVVMLVLAGPRIVVGTIGFVILATEYA